jgi:adenylate cyclase
MNSGFRSFFSNLRKKRIIEILAAFIAGGWLIIEFVDRILVAHYRFPDKTIDITFVTLLCALICTLLWRWFSGREKPRKFKLELVLIPLVVLITVLLDINLLLHLKEPESEAIPASKWKNSIAVLPFVDMSPQKDQEYFCDGITEELINRLSNIKELKVPARTSVFTFKGKADDIRDVGRKLDVQNVLEGSIRKEGNQLRITVQLVKASDSFHVWSETYDKELTKVFDIQDEIALAVADKLKFTLIGEERARLKRSSTTDSNAVQLYFKGKYFRYAQRPKDLLLARDYFEQAIGVDPGFAAAFAGLAEDYMILGHTSILPREEAASKAVGAAGKALELDDTLSEAHVSMGVIKEVFNWDWKGAEQEFKKAVALNPNNFDAHHEYGWLLMRTSRYGEAEEAFVHEKKLDPLNPMLFRDFRLLYLCQGQAAEDVKKRLKEITPDWAELWKETYPTVEKAEAIVQEQGRYPRYLADLAIAYYQSGNANQTSKLIEELESLYAHGQQGNVAYHLARIFYEHDEKDKAFTWLERAVENRATMVVNASFPIYFKSLQKEPRYQAILRRIGVKS